VTQDKDSTPSEDDLSAEAHVIVRMGKALLNAGACTYRVRRCMELVASAMDIEWLQSQVTLNELTVTLFKGKTFRTQVGQVHSIGVNADKLSRLERMAEELPKSTPRELERMIDAIDCQKRRYPPWLNALCAAIACTAVGFLNNAWWLAVAGILVGAFLGQFVRVTMARFHLNAYLTALTSALVASFSYVGITASLSALAPGSDYGAGCVSALIFLVPGFPLVNATLDLVKTDITAGLTRLTYAFLILVSAAAALVVATWAIGVQPTPLPPPPLDPALYWLLSAAASWIGVAGWAVMFNSCLSGAALAGCVGLIANLIRLGMLGAGSPLWLAAAVGCFVIGLLAYLSAEKAKLAYATIAVPAALIMVPGVPAYRALVAFSSGDVQTLLVNSSAAIFTIVGMAIGLSVARILTERGWVLDKRRPLGA
jgi:uncharacterized membrane protein YjjP (DUF1212 family)